MQTAPLVSKGAVCGGGAQRVLNAPAEGQ